MQINSINTSINQNKPAFGLKISDGAAFNIINLYKDWGASPEEISQNLRTLKNSQPDNVEIVAFNTKDHCLVRTNSGSKFGITSDMWLKYNNNVGIFNENSLYAYSNGKYSKVETNHHITNHLLDFVDKSINSLDANDYVTAPYAEYKKIIADS